MKTQNTHTNTNKRKKGFSLVELIVVIAILAVLSVTAVMSVGNISNQAADAAALSDANTIARALNTYNAMAKTPIKTTAAMNTVAALQSLTLSTGSGDLIDMALGVNVDQTRLTALAGTGYDKKASAGKITITFTNNMWVVTNTTT